MRYRGLDEAGSGDSLRRTAVLCSRTISYDEQKRTVAVEKKASNVQENRITSTE